MATLQIPDHLTKKLNFWFDGFAVVATLETISANSLTTVPHREVWSIPRGVV